MPSIKLLVLTAVLASTTHTVKAAATEDLASWCADAKRDILAAIKKTQGSTFARRPESQQVVEVSAQYITLLASIRRQTMTYDVNRRTLQAGRGLAAIQEVHIVLAKNPFERSEDEAMKFILDKSTGAIDKKLLEGAENLAEACR